MEPVLAENFRTNLRSIRTARKLTLQQLGDLLGVSHVTVHLWEGEKSNPTLESIEKVAEALGVHPRSLLEDPAPDSSKKADVAAKRKKNLARAG